MSEDAVAFNSEGRTAFWGPVEFVSFLVTFKITVTTTTTTTTTTKDERRKTNQATVVSLLYRHTAGAGASGFLVTFI